MPAYTYRCPSCDSRETIYAHITEDHRPPPCHDCRVIRVRDYRTDSPRPIPPWPEHFNPSVGKVIRTRQQLADQFARNDDELFNRTGIEQNTVVVDAADMTPPTRPTP